MTDLTSSSAPLDGDGGESPEVVAAHSHLLSAALNRLNGIYAEADVDDPFPGSPDTVEVPMSDLYTVLDALGSRAVSPDPQPVAPTHVDTVRLDLLERYGRHLHLTSWQVLPIGRESEDNGWTIELSTDDDDTLVGRGVTARMAIDDVLTHPERLAVLRPDEERDP